MIALDGEPAFDQRLRLGRQRGAALAQADEGLEDGVELIADRHLAGIALGPQAARLDAVDGERIEPGGEIGVDGEVVGLEIYPSVLVAVVEGSAPQAPYWP